jgi:hypothetical protein
MECPKRGDKERSENKGERPEEVLCFCLWGNSMK